MSLSNRGRDERQDRPRAGSVHTWLLADLKAWLDGELSAPRVWFVRAHLWVCPACREEVTWLKRLGEDMRDLERAVPSPRLRARILAALPDTPPGRPNTAPGLRAGWTRIAAAGAMACLGIAVWAAIVKYSPPMPVAKPDAAPGRMTIDGGVASNRAPVNSETAPIHIVTPTAPDPFTDEANRLYDEWTRRESRQLQGNQASWGHLVAAVRALRAARHIEEPLHLALAVPDIHDAEDRLAAWAAAVGGGVSSRPQVVSPSGPAPLVTTVEPVYRPAAPLSRVPEPRITVRVPLARVASLEPVLKQIGAWDSTQATGPATFVRPAAPERPASAAKPRPGTVVHADEPAPITSSPTTMATARPAGPDQVVSRDSGPSVTLQIHLTSLQLPVP